MRQLSTLTRQQGANRALIAGEVSPRGYSLRFADEPVLVKGFRKMVRDQAFDVAEMALTTYLVAREHGVPITAIPVFLVRDLHHGATQVLRNGPITKVGDLEGQRVGVNRGYTVTTGVWGRAALDDMGLDLEAVEWMLSGDEHVAAYRPPPNVSRIPDGNDLIEMLLAGELAATVGAAIDHPDVVPLIPEPDEAGMRALEDRGVFPINHLVVVTNALLAEEPGVAASLFNAFAEAKTSYISGLGASAEDSRQDRLLRRVQQATGKDPMPYGIAPNLATIETLLDHARRQRILTQPVDVAGLFATDTAEMNA